MAHDVGEIADRVQEALGEHRKYLRAYFDAAPLPPGLVRPSDEQFSEFVASMVSQYPPRPLLFPVIGKDGLPVLHTAGDFVMDDVLGLPVLDAAGFREQYRGGEPVTETRIISPWIAMLGLKKRDADGKPTGEPLVDGGDAVLRRIERVAAGTGGA